MGKGIRMLRRSAIVLVLLPWAIGLFPPTASAATITVTTTQDEWNENDAACGLREAIQAANINAAFGGCPAGSGPDTIQLATGPYILDEPNPDDALSDPIPDDTNENGDLDISADLTIAGPVSGRATIDANDLDRVLHVVGTGTDVSMQRLRIEDGHAAMASPGVSQDGGGVLVQGSLVLEQSAVFQNVATGYGGGLAGATLSIDRSYISGNQSPYGGGVATRVPGDAIIVADSILEGNRATNGGAAANPLGGSISLTRTAVRENDASQSGGGIYSLPFLGAASVTVTSSLFENNEGDEDLNGTGDGGGIWVMSYGTNVSDLTATGTTFRGNTAENGDGLWISSPSTPTIMRSTISSNGSTLGGGLGGGIYVDTDTTTALRNVTMDFNAASASGGTGGNIYNLGTVTLSNTLVGAHAAGGNCAGSGVLTDDGDNMEETAGGAASCVSTTVIDAGLGNLADNGGPQLFDFVGAPPTQALQAGSPAIGAGGDCGASDQRGVPRPQGNGCEVGAYEVAMCFGRRADDPVGITGGQTARTGTPGTDVLFGLGASETIRGLGGADRLCGGGGRDRLVGAAGPDRMNGGPQRDACLGGPGRDRARACERVTGVP
jgi:CSLREA domain-containing protein